MQRLIFLTPGRAKTSWIQEGVETYLHRLAPVIDFKVMEIPASRELDSKKHAQDESERMIEKLGAFEGDFWLLDERGKEMSSLKFAELLTKAKDHGRTLVFVMGGAFGVTDDLRNFIPHHLRLSEMTFPHDLCKIIFFEQVYRATEIQKGSGYHH